MYIQIIKFDSWVPYGSPTRTILNFTDVALQVFIKPYAISNGCVLNGKYNKIVKFKNKYFLRMRK